MSQKRYNITIPPIGANSSVCHRRHWGLCSWSFVRISATKCKRQNGGNFGSWYWHHNETHPKFPVFFFIWMAMYTVYMIKYHFDKGTLAQRNKYGSIYCLTRYLWCKRTEKHNFWTSILWSYWDPQDCAGSGEHLCLWKAYVPKVLENLLSQCRNTPYIMTAWSDMTWCAQ